jgi:sortase A
MTLWKSIIVWLERLLWIAAALSLGFFAWARLDSSTYQFLQARHLDEILTKRLGAWLGPRENAVASATRVEMARSGLIGRIEIPRLSIRAIVAEGTDARILRRSVGHLPGTALPGEEGNVAIAGHRDSFFSALRDVRTGDRVRITTPDGAFEYRVESKSVVSPEHTEVLSASSLPTLTLITCFPFRYVGSAPERFIVHARQLSMAKNNAPERNPEEDPGAIALRAH